MHTTEVNPPAAAAHESGLDRFLVGLARLAEMDVNIDESGTGDQAVRVDLLRLQPLLGRQSGHEPAVGDEEIAFGIAPGGRVDDAGVGYP